MGPTFTCYSQPAESPSCPHFAYLCDTKFLNQIRWFCPCIEPSGLLTQLGGCHAVLWGEYRLLHGEQTGPSHAPGDRELQCWVRSNWVHPVLPLCPDCPLHSRPLGCGPTASSLPPAVGNFSPLLLRKLLLLSPQVIFHHVGLKSWAVLGEGRGEQDTLTPSYLWSIGLQTP